MIIQKYIPVGTLRRSGQKILQVKGIVAHDTGNPNSTALQNANYYVSTPNEAEVSAHTFVDDVNIIEVIPQTEKAWHVRRNVSNVNDDHLAVELCYFPNDITRSQNAYKAYTAYIRDLCTKYQLDPKTSVKGHFQLDATRRTDPINAFKVIGKTWEQFIQNISVSAPIDKEKTKQEIIRLVNTL